MFVKPKFLIKMVHVIFFSFSPQICPCFCRSNCERIAGADRYVPAQDVGSDGWGPGGARLHHRHPRLQFPLLLAHSHEELRPTSGYRCVQPTRGFYCVCMVHCISCAAYFKRFIATYFKPTSVADPGFSREGHRPQWGGGANLLFGIVLPNVFPQDPPLSFNSG